MAPNIVAVIHNKVKQLAEELEKELQHEEDLKSQAATLQSQAATLQNHIAQSQVRQHCLIRRFNKTSNLDQEQQLDKEQLPLQPEIHGIAESGFQLRSGNNTITTKKPTPKSKIGKKKKIDKGLVHATDARKSVKATRDAVSTKKGTKNATKNGAKKNAECTSIGSAVQVPVKEEDVSVTSCIADT